MGYLFGLLIFAIALSSCSGGSSSKGSENEETAKEKPEKKADDVLELSLAQMQAVGITTGKIEQKNLDDVVKANGELAVPPQNKADVSILSGGIIRRIAVVEGEQVRKGQVLATIENQELIKIQQDYLAAINNFAYVDAEYQRQSQLQAAGAGTGKSFQSSQATYRAEQARIKAYESQLRQLGISPKRISGGGIVSQFPLISPIKGTVGTITATTGSFVQPGTAIMEVVDNSKIHCDLIVFEKDLYKVHAGQQVNFELTNQSNQQIKGKISGINKSFENESKGVVVHAVIDNSSKGNLIPGMYVTALISVGTAKVPALPVEAVISSEGKQYIYIVVREKAVNGNKDVLVFKKTEVATGTTDLGYIHIKTLENLPKDVLVVTKGAFYLQSKSAGNAEEE
ncbi:MAG: efflux RND transporter periplasmic adaptor subunit [Sphingobacteriaceae bacterium]|nr:MAG: efflux RND transporter periplasmic adaptor subunit [Sphingobacteriaceae bacterium]